MYQKRDERKKYEQQLPRISVCNFAAQQCYVKVFTRAMLVPRHIAKAESARCSK
jgi:hypothetical protein